MYIDMLFSKIHRATVTDSNLNYEGSITIDKKLLKEANLLAGQKVEIVNVNNGERFSTYIIEGESGDICINGAAARKASIGDKIIIIAYMSIKKKKALQFEPKIVFVDEENQLLK